MKTLTKIEAINPAGDILSLELADNSSGLQLEAVDGLDPVKATLTGSGYAGKDGAQFQSAKREIRALSIYLAFVPDYVTTQVPDLRNLLYSFFMPKTAVTLKFFLGEELVVTLACRTETMGSTPFSRNPGAKIDLLAFDPDFLEEEPTAIGGDTVDDSEEDTITYQGTVETGFQFDLNVDRDMDQVTVYLRTPDGTLRSMDVTVDMIAGDILTISTVRGNKYVQLLRSGIATSVLYAMSPQSSWLELFPGDNLIRVYDTGDPVLWTVTYTARYGGL
jgi:Phage tail protein.